MVAKGSTVVKGGIVLTALEYPIVFVNVILSIVVASYLGPTLYGIRGILLSGYSFISSGIIGMISVPLVKEYSFYKARNDYKKVGYVLGASLFFIISSTLTGILMISLIYITYYINVISLVYLQQIIFLLSISLICSSIYSLSTAIFLGEMNYKVISYFRILELSSTIIGYLTLILCNMVTLWNVFVVFTATKSLLAIFGAFKALIQISSSRVKIRLNKQFLNQFLSGLSVYGLGSFVFYIYTNLDSFILPVFIDMKSLGYYYFAKRILSLINIGFSKAKTFLLPFFSEKISINENRFTVYVRTNIKFTLVITTTISFLLSFFSELWLNIISYFIPKFSAYLEGSFIISIMSFIAILYPYSNDIGTYFNSLGKFKYMTINNILTLFVYSSVILTIGPWGVLWAAVGLLIAYIFRAFVWSILLLRYNIQLSFKRILSILVLIIIIWVSAISFAHHFLGFNPLIESLLALFLVFVTPIIECRMKILLQDELLIIRKYSKKRKVLKVLYAILFGEKEL